MKFYEYAEKLPEEYVQYFEDILLPLYPLDEEVKYVGDVDSLLSENYNESVYSFTPVIERFLAPMMDKLKNHFVDNKFYNSRMVRLSSIVEGKPLFNNVYYFDHRTIHHMADEEIYPGQTLRDVLEDVVIDDVTRVASGYRSDSLMPNGLGVSLFFITSDEYILITKRGKNVSIARNTYSPSITFGIKSDVLHVKNGDLLEWNLKNAILREYEFVPRNLTRTYYLGMYSNLYTLGAPEMYFVVFLDEKINEIYGKTGEENKKILAAKLSSLYSTSEIIDELKLRETSEHLIMGLKLIKDHADELYRMK